MRNCPEDQVKDQVNLFMIRHGATRSNEEHRYLGRTDEGLSRRGILSLCREKEKGRYPEADMVFCSPMKRCVETAKLLYPETCLNIVPEWTEIDFGDFEGKNYRELEGDERYQKWIESGGTLPFPGGESREAFSKRCGDGFCRMVERIRCAEYGGVKECRTFSVGMVVHGGTIMALLSRYGGRGYFDCQLPNGGGLRGVLWGALREKNDAMEIRDIEEL